MLNRNFRGIVESLKNYQRVWHQKYIQEF
jgi:hypothetical protein